MISRNTTIFMAESNILGIITHTVCIAYNFQVSVLPTKISREYEKLRVDKQGKKINQSKIYVVIRDLKN